MAWFGVKCILRLKKKVYSDDKKIFWNKAPPAKCWNYNNAVFHLIQQPARQRALKPIQRCLLYLWQFRYCRKSRTQEQWRFTEELEKQWKERNFMLWCNYYFYTVLKIIQLYIFLGFPDSLVGKESTCNAGDPGSILGLGRSLEKETATHSSILENPMDCIVHGARKESDTTEQLSPSYIFCSFFKKILFFGCVRS